MLTIIIRAIRRDILPNLQKLSADFNGFMPAAMSMPMPDAAANIRTQLSLAISSFLVRRRAQIATSII
jgi:hypothetical protein